MQVDVRHGDERGHVEPDPAGGAGTGAVLTEANQTPWRNTSRDSSDIWLAGSMACRWRWETMWNGGQWNPSLTSPGHVQTHRDTHVVVGCGWAPGRQYTLC